MGPLPARSNSAPRRSFCPKFDRTRRRPPKTTLEASGPARQKAPSSSTGGAVSARWPARPSASRCEGSSLAGVTLTGIRPVHGAWCKGRCAQCNCRAGVASLQWSPPTPNGEWGWQWKGVRRKTVTRRPAGASRSQTLIRQMTATHGVTTARSFVCILDFSRQRVHTFQPEPSIRDADRRKHSRR